MEGMGCNGDVVATPKRVILGDLNQGGSSPISPMANLKMLIKVATGSPQQSHQQLLMPSAEGDNPAGNFIVVTTPESKRHQPRQNRLKYTRQMRSLGFICKKFLQFYSLDVPPGENKEISLGNLATLLEIEKRRVYDIINVVSSLDMAMKVCKDRYIWYGSQYLPSVLLKLKEYALKNKLDVLIESVLRHPLNFLSDNSQNQQNLSSMAYSGANLMGGCFSVSVNNNNCCPGNNQAGEHSLVEDNRIGILCQKFITLFLVTPQNAALNLNIVSKLILPRDVQDKTGMRRLYDIANVLESLGLIARQSSIKMSRKPSFVYCGPVLSNTNSLRCGNPAAFHSLWKSEFQTDVFPLDQNDDSNSVTESDSQCSGTEDRLSSMLQVVCTELERLNEARGNRLENCRSPPSAKKQLFPPTDQEASVHDVQKIVPEPSESSFIKAPDKSFRLLCNRITDQPAGGSPPPAGPHRTSRYPFVSISGFRRSENGTPTIRLNKIARPIRIVKRLKLPTPSEIQNGAIYKAVKNGNVIHLVQL